MTFESVRTVAAAVIIVFLFPLNPALGEDQTVEPSGNSEQIVETGSASQHSPNVKQIIIVFKTHFDIGYTKMASEVIERYRTTMMDKALEVCDLNRDLPPQQQFVWTLPGWPMKKILEDWEGQTPQRRQRIIEACKEGRFVMHALPFTTYTELLELEDLVRGMSFSSRLSRAMDLELPRDAKMTDVPCHTWVIPTLLKHAGVDFFHIGCNRASESPEVPMLFWWEGPDGSRVLTMYASKGYGTQLMPPEDWPCKTWLALIHTGDNNGPPRPEEVKRLLELAQKEMPGVTVKVGRLSDFSDAIIQENPDLPVVRMDMTDTWIQGPGCDPEGAKIARNIRPDIDATESLNTQLSLWGVPAADISDTIDAAYENSLLYGEHTWGGALRWVVDYKPPYNRPYTYGETWKKERLEGRFDRIESSWEEHTAYIKKARDLIEPVYQKQLQDLAGAVNVSGKRIVVYNPLPWKRNGLVTLSYKDESIHAVRPVDGGPTLPVETKDGSLRFVAFDIPAMGYRTYTPVADIPKQTPLKADAHTGTLECAYFKAVVDPARGSVASLVEKSTGREMVDASAPYGFGQYLYERFDANDVQQFLQAYIKIKDVWAWAEHGQPNLPSAEEAPHRDAMAEQFTVRYEQSPFSITAVMEAMPLPQSTIKHPVTTKLTLYRDLPFVDLEVILHDKPADSWPEAGWICLPFKVQQPQYNLGRLGSIVDFEKDIIRGSGKHIMAINSAMAITEPQGWSAGLCPLDHALVSLGVPGIWKYSKDFVPANPYVFIHLFNNQTTTNFRFWNEGTCASRVRLWANGKYDPQETIVTPAQEARFPLRAACYEGPKGRLPNSQRGIELSRKGVVITAFGPDPEGNGTLLRLWERGGNSGICKISLPEGMQVKTARTVNLRGEPQDGFVEVKPNFVNVKLDAFAPTTILFDCQ